MRTHLIALALATSAIATPALARDGAWYVGGEFGAMIIEDTDVDIGGGEDSILTLNHEYGYDGGLFVGYDLGAFRLEGEVAYKKADLESFGDLIDLPGEGSTRALTFMLNGLADFPIGGGASIFGGGGIGYGRVEFEFRDEGSSTPVADGTDSGFAWQLVAGAEVPVADNLHAQLRFRYLNIPNLKIHTLGGTNEDIGVSTESILIGLRYTFGAPPPP